MSSPSDLAPKPGARLYLRPLSFIESPVGLAEDDFRRLAGGLVWFRAVEARWIDRDGRAERRLLPVAEVDGWIARLPAGLAERAAAQLAALCASRAPLVLGERTIRFDGPQVMGILNMTPDSFSDGGRHLDDVEGAADAGFAMQLAGAAIVDVGGESTRPGAATVWEGDEIARVVPVIERLARAGIVVSADTRKAAVMEAALAAGASIVNDVSALTHDPRALEVVARAGCPVVLMHVPSSDDDLHVQQQPYIDICADVFDWLERRVRACLDAGIPQSKIIVDPGIGFGKALAESLALINRLAMFHALGCPLLLGASRKRVIGALSNEAPAAERLGGSIALAMKGIEAGAQIVRVHDVPESVQAARVWRGLRDAALVAG